MSPVEMLGAATGISGAVLLAWRGRLAPWAWVLWIVSSIAWIVAAYRLGSHPLIAQQTIFLCANLLVEDCVMGAFDPSAMHVTRLAEADLGESVADTTAQISLIADGDVRQRCASAKLAAQIVSRVYHVSADLGDGEILGGMTNVLKRLAAVRQTCLAIAGVNEDHPDYGAAFAMCTAVALETVTEEFKWRQIGGRTKELPMALFGRLIEAVSAKQPRLFPKSSGQLDLGAARKLATLHAAPVMMGLVNLFDFYVMDTEPPSAKLAVAAAP
eukprot:gene42094-52180_t